MSLRSHLGVRVGDFDLDVNLDIAPGEVLAILGPNGAGKSTIVRALAGLIGVDRGHIELDGTVIDDPDAGVFVVPERRSVGVVFQDYLLFEHLSVLDNVAFGLRARGARRSDALADARVTLDQIGIADLADRRPGQLSGGQAQRVALARALAISPRLLLMDEPLAALDVATRAEVRRDLRANLDSLDTMRILVTHDPIDAHALADRIMIVEAGRVVQTGTLDAITARPRSPYVAQLVGVNLISGTVTAGVLHTETGAQIVVADAADGPAYAVIHPHSVTVTNDAPQSTSARNVWPGTITGIDRIGDRARLQLDGRLRLTAEVTMRAVDEMGLGIGDRVHATVKATDIDLQAQ